MGTPHISPESTKFKRMQKTGMNMVLHKTSRRLIQRTALSMAALALCLALVACQQTAAQTPSSGYTTTADADLRPQNTNLPPTEAPAAFKAKTTNATNTPRHALTYTPWAEPTKATTDSRQPAPPFNAHTLDGNEFSLEETLGSPTLIAFWAPW